MTASYLRASLVCCLIAAALEAHGETFTPGALAEKVVTLVDPDQQYALYLPPGYDPERSWPVLFVLDPRGRALRAMGLFRDGAEEHGWIVLSSYQSRSDTQVTITVRALEAMMRDAEPRFHLDPKRYYLAGMSGTSHLSWDFATFMAGTVAGVIGCGGGLSRRLTQPAGEVGFAYYGLTGTLDFNYQEMWRLEAQLAERRADHRLEVFAGRHGWPPDKAWTRAGIDWLELIAMKRGLAPRREAWLEARWKAAAAAVEEAGDPAAAYRRLDQQVRDFEGLRGVETLRERVAEANRSPEVTRWYKREKKLAGQESIYLRDRLGGWTGRFWSDLGDPLTAPRSLADLRIKYLRKQAADANDPQSANSAKRLLETVYTQTSFYLPRESQHRGDVWRAELSLSIAEEIFPDRPRIPWGRAKLYAETGRLDQAFEALGKAVTFGVDIPRLAQDPTWEPLHADPRWEQFLKSLRDAEAEQEPQTGGS